MAESIKIKGALRSQISDGDKISKKWMECLGWEDIQILWSLHWNVGILSIVHLPQETDKLLIVSYWGLLTNENIFPFII